jgi:hypothetical protein
MGYWTPDFLVVQRILAAKDIRSAEMAPIIGAGFKMLVPFIVILPGLLGLAVLPERLVPESVAAVTGAHSYHDVLPLMLARYCRPGLLGLGVTALIAGVDLGKSGSFRAALRGALAPRQSSGPGHVSSPVVVHHLCGGDRDISFATKPIPDSQLTGLVYGLTEVPSVGNLPLYQKPLFWAGVVTSVFVVFNIIF